MRRLNILTWHTHGSYLYYLTQAPHEFYVLSKPDRPPGYAGVSGHLPWGPNVHDLPAAEARRQPIDLILFQDDGQYLDDQHDLLTPAQRALPKIYLEHDPPRDHPVDTRHLVRRPDVLVVHCTHFNRLMWDNGPAPTRVIEHGVVQPAARWSGELERGLVVVNNLEKRGRRLGADVFRELRKRVPLDLVGMGAEEAGGLGEVRHDNLAAFAAQYRFFFNPIRYTSLGLAVIEAMMIGMPVVALATTEMATVIRDGENGIADTDVDRLAAGMKRLLADPLEARRLGEAGRRTAVARFNIERFAADWDRAFSDMMRFRHERFVA
jgi:glycosyltransferase involved in cell wall biosynthesis